MIFEMTEIHKTEKQKLSTDKKHLGIWKKIFIAREGYKNFRKDFNYVLKYGWKLDRKRRKESPRSEE